MDKTISVSQIKGEDGLDVWYIHFNYLGLSKVWTDTSENRLMVVNTAIEAQLREKYKMQFGSSSGDMHSCFIVIRDFGSLEKKEQNIELEVPEWLRND